MKKFFVRKFELQEEEKSLELQKLKKEQELKPHQFNCDVKVRDFDFSFIEEVRVKRTKFSR